MTSHMTKMTLTSPVFLLLLSVSSAQVFHGDMTFTPACPRWSYTGTLTLTPAQLQQYGSKVTIQVSSGEWGEGSEHWTRRVCDIDLEETSTCSPPGDACHVTYKSDDVYTLRVTRLMSSEEISLTVQAVLQSRHNDTQQIVVTSLGSLPNLTDSQLTSFDSRELTYQFRDGKVEDMRNSNKPDTVCGEDLLPVRFCAKSLQDTDEIILRIRANGQITESRSSCVEAALKLMTSNSSSRHLVFEFEDPRCARILSFEKEFPENDPDKCETKQTVISKTILVDPQNACAYQDGSLAREVQSLSTGVQVLCDTQTDGGGWVIFQRRLSPEVDFYRDWKNYSNGFGDLSTSFWLGLTTVHEFCPTSGTCEMRVDIQFGGRSYYQTYQDFHVDGEENKFRLHLGTSRGTAGDGFKHKGKGNKFSTHDHDHDRASTSNCAQVFHGAWWYDDCHDANLNGDWGSNTYGQGMVWRPTTGYYNSVSASEMKFRLKTK